MNMSAKGIRVTMKGTMKHINEAKEHLEDKFRIVGFKGFRVHKVKEDGGWDETKYPSDEFKTSFVLYVNGRS